MPPLPPSGERRQPRFTASRQPFTTVVRPRAARCCKNDAQSLAQRHHPAESVGNLGVGPHAVQQAGERQLALRAGVAFQHRPSRRRWIRQHERSRRRRPRVGFAERLRDPPAVVARQRQRRSRTIAALRPSTRRAVLETLRSSTSRTRDNCAIVCVCAFIRCALCRPGSDAGGRQIVHWVSRDDDMAALARRGTK